MLWTVGAAGPDDRPPPYSAQGSPANAELLTKPDVPAYDAARLPREGTVYGTDVATPFAAGIAAVRMQASASRRAFLDALRRQVGKVLSAVP